MRYAPRAILAGGLGFAASFVVACGGGSGLLSGDQSNALSSQADQVVSAVQSTNCGAAVSASAVLSNQVQTLSVTINSTLRSNLSQAASTISQLAQHDCRQRSTSTASTSSTSTSTTTSTSTSTSTSSSTPTSTTSSTPTSTSSTSSSTSSTATTPTLPGSTSTTTGGVGLGAGTTTAGNGNGNSGGTGAGSGGGG